MSNPQSPNSSAATREKMKLAAIPVLFLILIWVVYSQISDSEETFQEVGVQQPTTVVRTRTPEASNSVVNKTVAEIFVEEEPIPDREWLESPLEEILKHDPFVKTESLKSIEEKLAETEAEMQPGDEFVSPDDQERVKEALGTAKTKILIKSEKGSAALIGSRLVREGDIWEEGIRIKSIDLEGVTVAPDRDEEFEQEKESAPEKLKSTLKKYFPGLLEQSAP
ncbi:MAG: hypothetical protein KDA65_05585 [Planctomycetaceae bacterium]|nr:hypothetical protein [Planctomycetaceae bacterium]